AHAMRAIGPDETSDVVEHALSVIGARLLAETLDAIASGLWHEEGQDDSEATYAARLTKEDGVIDWTSPAPAIHNRIRGLHPWPHAFTFHDGKRLILLRSMIEAHEASLSAEARSAKEERPGVIVEAAGDRLVVGTGSGRLRLTDLQAEGRRPMSVRDFLAGHRLAIGDRLAAAP
ncbi:MAG TPA: hypothetical protein VEU08_21735, partial [Vicinamibacterales bacterium]|nr:hypothetical protein [Vicinamibacterales bacterium]